MRELCRAAGDAEGECQAMLSDRHLPCGAPSSRRSKHGTIQPARAFAERIGNQALLAEVDNARGDCTTECACGQLAEADAAFERGILVARSLKHRPAMVVGLMFSGILHFWRSDTPRPNAFKMEAIATWPADARDGFHLPLALSYLGLTLANRGRISEAMGSMQEALDMARRNNNAVALSRIPNGIGWVSREIGNLGKAIRANEACVEFSRCRHNPGGSRSERLPNLVYDYMLAGEPRKCEDSLELVLPLSRGRTMADPQARPAGIRHNAASPVRVLVSSAQTGPRRGTRPGAAGQRGA